MPSNEQHLQLVLEACQAKRDADMRTFLELTLAAFSFGSGCAFVWLLVCACISVF